MLEHGLALALVGRCPFCAEVTSRPGVLRSRPCDVCGGRLPPGEEGFGPRVMEELRALTRERFWIVLGIAMLVSVLTQPMPLLSLAPQILALVAFRMFVSQPCLSLVSGTRRFVANWTLRMTAAWTISIGSLLLLVPCAAALETFIVITLFWQAGRRYCLWQLERERDGVAVAAWEWGVLVASFAVMLFGVFLAIGLAVTIYETYSELMSCLS